MKHSTKTLALLSSLPLFLSLAACSPHPATGVWAAAEPVPSGFNRLEVTYEGRANLFAVGEETAGRHCFWGGESKQAIRLTCRPAEQEIDESYRFVINADGTATLMQDETALVRLARPAQ